MKEKYILFINYGSIAEKHIKIIKKKHTNYKIIVYRSGKSNKLIDKNVDIEIKSLKKTLSYNFDEIFICSPAVKHIEYINFFLKYNKKIFVEKPLTNFIIKRDLIKLINKKNLIFQIGYVFKFDESLNRFRDLIKKKFVGKILKVNVNASSYLPKWRKKQYSKSVSARKKLGGGALLELSHEIDYITWIFSKIHSVFAIYNYSNSLKIDSEDNVDIILKTHQNYNITVNLNFNQKKEKRFCEVIGTKGIVKIDLLNKKIITEKYNYISNTIFFKKNKILMYEKQLNYFLKLKKKLKNNINSLDSAIKTQILLDNIATSNKKKKIIYL